MTNPRGAGHHGDREGSGRPGQPGRRDGPGRRPDPPFQPDSEIFRPDAEIQQKPRRSRQPVLTAAALIGIILLVLALVIFGGM